MADKRADPLSMSAPAAASRHIVLKLPPEVMRTSSGVKVRTAQASSKLAPMVVRVLSLVAHHLSRFGSSFSVTCVSDLRAMVGSSFSVPCCSHMRTLTSNLV
eukprot:CAMPEP_0115051806 /NCGR_PEP_ID=MMETSP0227-20121206/2555_1 /TAXON_ID=89957 /ORGANISM="Polarella glacialis, Strain CCMP 1383" /LENGTH=101 /DNA_ID=CAMNT_0002435835 /DNA_START=575 /DNA_END=877 /DNA_ORIENTATION=+